MFYVHAWECPKCYKSHGQDSEIVVSSYLTRTLRDPYINPYEKL